MKFQKLISFIILVFGFNISFAQNFQLKSSSFNNGFGKATSGTFQLNGAVGEISSGPSASTSFVLSTGSVSNRVASAIDPGLIAHYRLDGDLLDATGNGYDAEAIGTLELTTDVAGIADKAYYFDGFETKAYHTFVEPLNLTNFTVSVWVYIENPSATLSQHIIGLESSTRLFQMVAYQGNFGFWEGSSDGTDDLGYVSLGQVTAGWHNFIVTWDGTVVTGYIDGTALNYGDAPTSLNFNVEELNIGANNAFGEYLEGAVDEVKVFNYPLTIAEVQELFFSYPPAPVAPQNLQAKVIGPGSIQLTWDDGANESYYDVYWEDPDLQSGYIELGPDVTSYTLTGLTTDFEYYIEVGAGNDYFGYDYSMIYQTPVDKGPTQAAPEYFTLDETVTIQFYPQLSYPVDDLTSASKVYMYAGLIKPEDVASGAWSNSVGNWGVDDGIGEMTYNLGVWEITITPRSYFGVPDNFVAAQMAIVFTNEDGTLLGKAADLEDIKLEIFDPTNIAPLGGFLDTDPSTDVYLDNSSAFSPGNLTIEGFTDFTIEALVNFNDANPGAGAFTDIVTRGFHDGSNYFPYHGVVDYSPDGALSFPAGLVSTDVSGSTVHYLNPYLSADITGTSTGYTNNTWAHVALIYTTPSTGNMDVYINGIYQGFVEVFETPLVGNMLRIGQFEGGVDELRFWGDARTEEELRVNMKSEIDAGSEGLIGYWKMNGTTTSNDSDFFINDETSSGNDLIVGNAVITQLPDLDVITLAVNPKSIAQTETISVSYTIDNIGQADAGAFDLDFYISADLVFDGTDTQLGSSVNFASGLTTGESVFNIFQAPIPDEGTIPNGNYYIIAVLDDVNAIEEENETNNTASVAININTSNINNVTTSITLDNYSFAENAAVGTVVGGIFYDDPDEDLFDITLVAGSGDTDNGLFQIVGGELITDAVLDFEVDPSSYSVRIQVDDNRGGVYAEAITLTLTDVNDNPSNINLSGTSIVEGTYSGGSEFVIGTLTTDDQDAGDTHTYIISSGGTVSTGSTVGVLSINGNNELIASGNYNRNDVTELSISINSMDQDGGSIDQPFTITIDPAGLAPTALLLTNNTINENHGAGATIGQFFAVDGDSDTHTYALAAGGTDNAEFSVSPAGELTQNNENLAVGTYSIRVSATDDTDLSITRTFSIVVISDAVSGVISVGGSQNNYRLIGIPFTNAKVGDIFTDLSNDNNFTDWRMFSYNNGSLSEIKSTTSTLKNGDGYWFISTIQQSVELPAGNVNTNPTISKSLNQGWNLIGNPFLTTLNWATVLDYNENIAGSISSGDVGGEIFTWNGTWNQTNTLGIMQGGFVNVNTASSSFVYPSATASLGSARTTTSRSISSFFDNTQAWQLYLNIESKGISSNISGVGLNELSIDGKDALDIAPPPTPAIFDPLQLTEKATGLTKNIKAVNHSVFWDFALTGTQETTTITWDQNVASQLDEPLIIALLPQGDLYDMGSSGELTFKPEKNQSVMVVYGDELPKELLYNAITAYPNPADQEVNFRFYVDNEGNVPAAIEFYDISGQQIGSIDQMVTGGQWNEINYKVATQDLLKSGIYLFRVKYDDFESAVKRLIIK
tara:strand:+ start:6225 stop:11000 length:4776 start_codon:yes stop_codon:yes gene_type:complete